MFVHRRVIANVVVVFVMAVVVSSASANRLSISHGSLWLTPFRPLRFTGLGGQEATRCEVILEGSFHSATVRKVEGLAIGVISRASIRRCELGSATILSETLPWAIQYAGFNGTLPEITAILLNVSGVSMRLKEENGFGAQRICLFRTSEAAPLTTRLDLETGEIGGYHLAAALEIYTRFSERLERDIRCGSNEFVLVEGAAPVLEVPGESTNILVKLI